MKGEEFFCIHCELNFGEILPTRDFHSELEQLFWGKTKIEKAISSFQFYKQENLQHLIHEFKYNGNFKIAVKMGELMAYEHNGFWQCMDTKRDLDLLETMWMEGDAPWSR